MRLIKVAAAVLNQTPLDWKGNRNRIREVLHEAKRQSVSVVCLPELCLTGYGCEDAFHAPAVQQAALESLIDLLPDCQGMVVSLGLPLMVGGGLYNVAALVVDGRIAGFVAKQNLAGDGIHYEPRWFKAWPEGKSSHVEVEGRDYPIGDLIFEVGDIRFGFEICEDAWVGQRPGARQAAQGVDVILNPSASHFAFGKHEIRKRFIQEGSRSFFVTYVYANLLGNESGRAIFDGDAMIAAEGRVLASGQRFSFRDWQLTSAVTDVDTTRMQRARTTSFRPTLAAGPHVVECDTRIDDAQLESPTSQVSAWESSEHLKAEEFTRAVALGLFDYLRKSRSRGFVVSLSDGADSAAIASLVYAMVSLSRHELGAEAVRAKLGTWLEIDDGSVQDSDSVKNIVRQLLFTVYQSTRNSTETTRLAARGLAEGIGALHREIDVDGIVAEYRRLTEECLG